MAFSEKLRSMDAHSFVSKEFRVYTMQGAILSVVTLVSIAYLVMTEIGYNFQTITTDQVHVNGTSSRGLEVEFDITLPLIPCNLIAVDANDPTGQEMSLHLDTRHHIWKHRMKSDGRGNMRLHGKRERLETGSTLLKEESLESIIKETAPGSISDSESSDDEGCGSCFGAGEEGECCNTCEDVKRAYQRRGWQLKSLKNVKQCAHEIKHMDQDGEGCNVHGVIALDSGGGNFHIAPSRDTMDALTDNRGAKDINEFLNKILSRAFENWNVTHTVNKIRFGQSYPGHVHQLDGETRSIGDGHGMYQYYFKIVPTRYVFLNGTTIQSNQYSVTEHLRHVNPGSNRGLPGVFFFYEVSPLHVEIVEGYRKGWVAFFTSVCAIVGGVVTVMGMVDQFLHSKRGSAGGSGLVL